METDPDPTLAKLFDLAHDQDLRKWATVMIAKEIIKEPLFAKFLQNIVDGDERTIGNIITSFRSAIRVLGIPSVQKATAKNDLPLDKLRERKQFICLQFPAQKDHKIIPLITALWEQTIDLQTRENNPDGLPILSLLDEFGNLGRVNALSDGMTFLRSYKVRLILVVQHLGQILDTYGEHATRSFLSAKAKVFYGLTDLKDARFVSELLGKTEKQVKSKSVQTTPGKGTSVSINTCWHQKELMTPDEVMRLKRNKGLIVLEGNYPMLVNKKPWSKFKKFKTLLRGDE